MLHHLIPALYALFSRGHRSIYCMSFSSITHRQERWASINYARRHNHRGKIIRRRQSELYRK